MTLDFKSAIEQRLEELVPDRDESLIKAARYSLLSPGKRLRPLLTLETASCLGGDPYLALDPACAIEMVHAYSLIHDDLPCMDDDDLRRGRPTLHKVFGEATALLAGDFLLTYSFETIANSLLSDHQKIEMVRILSNRAGSTGMIGGQAIDIESEGKTISPMRLEAMHKGKTAALLQACLAIGAIAAGASLALLNQLQAIGEELGLAYQIQDDFLNATSTTAILGKKAGSDKAKDKATAVSILGIEGTKQKIDSLHVSLQKRMEIIPQKNNGLFTLIEKIFVRNS